jgi:hypothetical protein
MPSELKMQVEELGAYLIDNGSQKVWVPKAAVEYDELDGVFTLPRAMAQDKGLI